MKKVFVIIIALSCMLLIATHIEGSKLDETTVFLTEDTFHADKYARETWEEMLLKECRAEGEAVCEDTELGTGIKVESKNGYYIYPIAVKDEVKYVYRVYQEGEKKFTGIISELLADELNNLREANLGEIVLAVNNDNLLAVSSSEVIVVSKNPQSKPADDNEIEVIRKKYFSE